ncbi:MAG: DEAD/DEAH box helicase [Bacteroidetes bacterium]|nr:DEAD/DEAH box helicase [Bacteroidota bacterium]
MIIDFNENIFTINDASFNSQQISQLKFWGFKSVGKNAFIFSGNATEKMLIKSITYFQKEKLKFTLSKKGESRVKSIAEQIAEFQSTKKLGENFKNGVYSKKKFKEFEQFFKTHLPKRKLKPHQLKAAFHLYLIQNGANFSVPGSGKTSVVLSVYEKLRYEGKVNVLFVVGPPACFGPWKNEFIETIGRKPKQKVLAGGDKGSRKSEYLANNDNKHELYCTTFQTLINDQKEINTFFSQKEINVFLVIDEAHYIKQINGNWASAVLNIAEHSKFRCILTGTPIPKSFSDIYNLFAFLWPKNETIESTARIKLQTLEKGNKIPEAKAILENRIGSLFYRVRKKDLGLTEQVFHDPIVLPMNKYEKTIYEAIDRKIRHYAMDDYLQNIDFINKLKRGRMIRLRQSVSYLPLLTKVVENYDEDILKDEKDLRYIVRDYDILELPAKFEYLTNKVGEFQKQNEKVVIWTNFIGTIEKLENHFNKNLKMYCRSIYGKTPIEESSITDEKTREEIREEFLSPKSGLDILIANPAACAESISLHKTCHNAIYYDLTYNCAQYLQSLDRIHRVGGSEEIEAHYYFLQYENSIDQDILSNLRRKADRMSKIIDEDYRIYSLDMFDDEDEEINAYNRLFRKK